MVSPKSSLTRHTPAHIGTYALPARVDEGAHIAGYALAVSVLLEASGRHDKDPPPPRSQAGNRLIDITSGGASLAGFAVPAPSDRLADLSSDG